LLGLRRFNRVQIDIWQGDISTFAADGDVRLQSGNTSAVELKTNGRDSHSHVTIWIQIKNSDSLADDELLAVYEDIFRRADAHGLRHLTIPVPLIANFNEKTTDSFVKTGMLALSAYLKSSAPQKLSRVTFVAKDLSMYDSLQRQLFAEFPDELDEEGY